MPPMTPQKDYYTVAEAATFLGFYKDHVRELLRSGKIAGEQIETADGRS